MSFKCGGRPAIALAVAALLAAAGDAHAATADGRRDPAARALRTGHYEDARRAACARAGRGRDDATNVLACAQAEVALGLYADARQRLESATENHPDDLPARDALMRLYALLGDRAALAPLIDASYADWNGGHVSHAHARDLLAIATAVRLDGNWKDANDVLRDAVRAEPRVPAAAIAANLDWGAVLLEKHNAADAGACFADVIKLDPDNPDAHVGLARVAIIDRYDAAAAREELTHALAVNPSHVGALALRAELALDAEDWDAARADVAAIRRVNPRDPGAARVAAAEAFLRDDAAAYARERDAALAVHPRDAALYAFVADALTRHRRYDDAREVASAGVEADPDDAACLSMLATTLLRLGDEDRGLETLRRAWKRDPYDVRTYNLLNLFEKAIPARYVTVQSAHLRLRIPADARTAVEQVVIPFLEDRYRAYVARYGFEPHGPVTLELYADPKEFAVRTVGLPSIGVVGVCFGRVITSQSPTNHAFNWGMVLGHELAHVFAIELSRSRVPRWFTEGLSEVETMRARPEWTRHDDLALYGAWKRGDLPTLDKLSDAFVNARDGDEAVRAYAHAALAVDFLERRFGFAAIRDALAAYGRGESERAVLERLAGMKADALEALFREELARRFARYETQYLPVETAVGVMRAAFAALNKQDLPGAQRMLEKLRPARSAPTATPDTALSADAAGALFLRGEIALARRDAAAAVAAFEGLLVSGRDSYEVRVRLGLAEIHRKNAAAAEAHLRRAIAWDPSRLEPHALLAELYGEQQRTADRIAELGAALRLDPQSDAVAKEAVLGDAAAGHPARVVELAPIAIFIDPADADLHAALGRALAATGQRAAGAAALERALFFHPRDPTLLHHQLAALYDAIGDRARATAHRSGLAQ
jgi:predicted Zn-dependent protease